MIKAMRDANIIKMCLSLELMYILLLNNNRHNPNKRQAPLKQAKCRLNKLPQISKLVGKLMARLLNKVKCKHYKVLLTPLVHSRCKLSSKPQIKPLAYQVLR
jgi:hypothetical protein